jgi:hypothetical protein
VKALAERAGALFLAPVASSEESSGHSAVDVGLPRDWGRAVVVGRPRDSALVAAVLANELRRHAQVAVALLLAWDPSESRPALASAPALPAARRLTVRLENRGLKAEAVGRLARVRLPPDPGEAAAAAERAFVAAEAPSVLAIGGPRPGIFDALVRRHRLAVVVTSGPHDEPVAALAMDGLRASSVDVVSCPALPAGSARALAALGFGRSAPLRATVAQMVLA